MSAARLLCCIALAVTLCTVSALTPPTNHNPFLLLSNSTDSLAATSAGDTAWLLTSGALVSLMTPGLAFFYGGLVESTTVLNTLMMSYVCAAIVTVRFCIFCSEKSLSTILFIFVAFTDPISGVWLFTRVQRHERVLWGRKPCSHAKFESRHQPVAESKYSASGVHFL
jgi:hypothetical protein